MADFALNFRVGGEKRGTAVSDPTFIANKAVDVLRAAAERKTLERVLETLVANADTIIADVRADADKFAGSAARVFTRQRSPGSGALSISLDDISRGAGIASSDSLSKRLKGKTTVQWLALSRKTVANKRRRMKAGRKGRRGGSAGQPDTFFVDSGALRDLLIQHLGPAMALLVDPKVVVRRGSKKVTATMSVLAQASGREKAGVTGESFPGASGRGVARDESLFVRYLKRAGAADRDPKHPLRYKLENPRGAHRPFLQNTLAFWISSRLPLVLEKSLRSALAKRLKKV